MGLRDPLSLLLLASSLCSVALGAVNVFSPTEGLLAGWSVSVTNGDSRVLDSCSTTTSGKCLALSLRPFGSFQLTSTTPFAGRSVLDVTFKGPATVPGAPGSDALRSEVSLQNTRLRLNSDPLLAGRLSLRQAKVLSGPDGDGWTRAMLNLYNVTQFTEDVGLPDVFNSLLIRDVSGLGLTLSLSKLSILGLDELYPVPPPAATSTPQGGQIASVSDLSGGAAGSDTHASLFEAAGGDAGDAEAPEADPGLAHGGPYADKYPANTAGGSAAPAPEASTQSESDPPSDASDGSDMMASLFNNGVDVVDSGAGGGGSLDSGSLGDSGFIDRVPVFGIESVSQSAGGDAHRFILRLKPGVTNGELTDICSEGDRRDAAFSVTCRPPAVDDATVQDVDAEAPGFVSVTVSSMKDLDAMRASLGDQVQFIERDYAASLFGPSSEELELEMYGEIGAAVAAAAEASIAQTRLQLDRITGRAGLRGNRKLRLGRRKLAAADASSPASGAPDVNVSDTASIQAAASVVPGNWGQDRVDQLSLPLSGTYTQGPVAGEGVHIFILDTGIRTSHSEFTGRIGEGKNCLGTGSIDVTDGNGHGTHVAGLAAGRTYGLAPKATLHPVKVMGDDGQGGYSNIIAGLQWVGNYVQRMGIRAAVVNLSVGGPRSTALNDAARTLVSQGVTVVVAAGNSHADACSFSPASASSVITVGATDKNDYMSSFSNYGNCLSIFAPGSSLLSAGYTCDTCTATMSGTSMASPMTAGAAAVYLSAHPTASPAAVSQALSVAAVEKTFESRSPSLLLNIMASRLDTNPPPPPPPPPPAPVAPVAPAPVTPAAPANSSAPAAPSWGTPAPVPASPAKNSTAAPAPPAVPVPAPPAPAPAVPLTPAWNWNYWPFLDFSKFLSAPLLPGSSVAATEASSPAGAAAQTSIPEAVADQPLVLPGWS